MELLDTLRFALPAQGTRCPRRFPRRNANKESVPRPTTNRCPRGIYQALGNLPSEAITAELGSYLEKAEIEGLLGRCKRIREILDRKITASSEAAVLFDFL